MQGTLLATASSPDDGKSAATPIVVADRTGGFLVGWWGGYRGRQPLELRRYAKPWSAKPTALGFQLEPKGHVMQISPSGKFLAVGHHSGNWQATLYNLDQQKMLIKVNHIRVCSGIEFTPDEAILISRSQGEIILTSIETLQEIGVIQVGLGEKIALHPKGRYLLAEEHRSRLVIIDLYTQQIVKELSTTAFDMQTWMTHALQGQAVTGFYPNDMIVQLKFSPDGNWLLCAMKQGTRFFDWSEVLASSESLPAPVAFSSSEVVENMESRFAMTYDITFDWKRNALLSCGLDSKVKSLDLKTGDTKTLMALPGDPTIWRLSLSHDLTALATHSLYNSAKRIPKSSVVEIWDYLALV